MTDPAALARENRRGATAMCVAFAAFIVNDTLVKLASEKLPTGQTIFLRGVFATLLLLALCAVFRLLPRWRTMLAEPVATRCVLDAASTLVYLAALFNLPIADATAINLAVPLILTAIAALFLAERVGWRRWCAVLAGFAGVLLIVQPAGDGFNEYGLLALGGTLIHAVRDLSTRRIDPATPSLLVSLGTAIAVTVAAAGLTALEGWRPPDLRTLMHLQASSAFLIAGYYFIVEAMRHGEVSLVSAFRYSGVLWALAVGWAVWGTVPDGTAWVGIALLVGAGLYTVHRERARARERAARSTSD